MHFVAASPLLVVPVKEGSSRVNELIFGIRTPARFFMYHARYTVSTLPHHCLRRGARRLKAQPCCLKFEAYAQPQALPQYSNRHTND